MKKKLFLAFVFTLIAVNSFAQLSFNTWYPKNIGTTNNLNCFFSVSSSSNYLIGNGGLMYKYIDTGYWALQNSLTTNNLFYGKSNSYGYAYIVGANGTILKNNGGTNWTILNSGTNQDLYSFDYSSNWPLAVGNNGTIIQSTNSGLNWTPVPVTITNDLKSVKFEQSITHGTVGFLAGDNGYVSKLQIIIPPLPAEYILTQQFPGVMSNFRSIYLSDTNNVIIVGSGGKIIKTTNSGINWTLIPSGTTNDLNYITSTSYNDKKQLFICGSGGILLKSTDEGMSWAQHPTSTTENILSISENRCWIAGTNGKIFRMYPLPNGEGATSLVGVKLNGNNISAWIWSRGVFDQDLTSNNKAGFEWPKGTGKTAIFTAGLNIAAMVNGNIREAAVSYKGEYTYGVMNNQVPSGNQYIETYKVSRGDNAYNNIYYSNWGQMVPFGAPYVDVNHNNQFDALIDTPGVSGASQTIFICLTDGFTYMHTSGEGFGGGTLPLYADLRLTAWCYSDSILKDVQFLKYVVINKSNSQWNNTYFSIFSDPDIGNSNDDYIGCDSVRKLGYGYNGDNNDEGTTGIEYGINPPAVGFRFLKTPINRSVIPYDTLKMTSYDAYYGPSSGAPWCQTDPNGEQVGAYNLIKGFKKDMSPWMDPTFTPPVQSMYIFYGDPETNVGWTEFKGSVFNCGGPIGTIIPVNPKGNRSFVMSSGKDNFTINPGESQTIVIAQLIARGSDYLNSVTKLKQLSDIVANFYQTVGITNEYNIIPTAFSLSQNYPNPFNPTTKIKFDVAKSSPLIPLQRGTYVKLVIYDILGKEVQTLINEKLNSGTYEVTFDGSNFPSGIYFYRLTAGEFSETKKMILLK